MFLNLCIVIACKRIFLVLLIVSSVQRGIVALECLTCLTLQATWSVRGSCCLRSVGAPDGCRAEHTKVIGASPQILDQVFDRRAVGATHRSSSASGSQAGPRRSPRRKSTVMAGRRLLVVRPPHSRSARHFLSNRPTLRTLMLCRAAMSRRSSPAS